jgi:uncharacterized protein with NAD-binding domain and iron-sulfur cluster
MSEAQAPGKRKIAVLGGGCGSMSAVWALTELPGWQDRFDITVYQVGWRLGGKCASGRNASAGQRIEEHGLHVWAGFYENGFKLMQQSYAALPPEPDNPIQSWQDAFRKHSAVMLQESIGGRWIDWPMTFPENDAVPGTGGELPTAWQYVKLVIDWMLERLEASKVVDAPPPGASASPPLAEQVAAVLPPGGPATEPVGLWQRLFPGRDPQAGPPSLTGFSPHDILRAAKHFASALEHDVAGHFADDHRDLLVLVDEAMHRFDERAEADLDDDMRRLGIVLNLAHATIKGMIVDGVLFFGFQSIDGVEWRDWMRRHGAKDTTIDSAVVRGIYDYVFGFFKGRAAFPQIEAGTALHGGMRLFFTYKGALFWEMQAGMGDIVFAPLYRALVARGVHFRFFSKVTNLRLSVDGRRVERIELLRQARPKTLDYDPLVKVGGIRAWPSEPLYDQLVEGDDLRHGSINLESAWTTWTGEPVALAAGTDFDDVLLGLSIAAARDVCGDLVATGGRFASMMSEVQTVQTAALQLWFAGDAASIGADPVPRIGSAYAEVLNTWSDMSFLLPREQWPAGAGPGYLVYLCGEFPDPEEVAPFSDPTFPAREMERFRQAAIAWLTENAAHLWSKTGSSSGPRFAWELLFDSQNRSGPDRLLSQYLRVNIDPTERYVASFPGTSRYRLRAGDSGFSNLYLAGDWVRTSINAGCVEAAVMAGMDAAAAISGIPIPVVGGLA